MSEHRDLVLDNELRGVILRRADAAFASPEPLGWDDVLRRASRPEPRRLRERRGRALILALALALALIVVAAPLGVAARVYHSVTSSSPPPLERVDRQLSKIKIGNKRIFTPTGPKLHNPGIVDGTTRLVASLRLANGRTARVWAARTRAGGFCFISAERPFGRGGCSKTMPSEPIWTRFGLFYETDAARAFRPTYSVVGRVQIAGARSIEIRYRDGTVLHAAVSNSWFMAVIPPSQGGLRSRQAVIVAIAANGRELASTDVDPPFGKGAKHAEAQRRPPPPAGSAPKAGGTRFTSPPAWWQG